MAHVGQDTSTTLQTYRQNQEGSLNSSKGTNTNFYDSFLDTKKEVKFNLKKKAGLQIGNMDVGTLVG